MPKPLSERKAVRVLQPVAREPQVLQLAKVAAEGRRQRSAAARAKRGMLEPQMLQRRAVGL